MPPLLDNGPGVSRGSEALHCGTIPLTDSSSLAADDIAELSYKQALKIVKSEQTLTGNQNALGVVLDQAVKGKKSAQKAITKIAQSKYLDSTTGVWSEPSKANSKTGWQALSAVKHNWGKAPTLGAATAGDQASSSLGSLRKAGSSMASLFQRRAIADATGIVLGEGR